MGGMEESPDLEFPVSLCCPLWVVVNALALHFRSLPGRVIQSPAPASSSLPLGAAPCSVCCRLAGFQA